MIIDFEIFEIKKISQIYFSVAVSILIVDICSTFYLFQSMLIEDLHSWCQFLQLVPQIHLMDWLLLYNRFAQHLKKHY